MNATNNELGMTAEQRQQLLKPRMHDKGRNTHVGKISAEARRIALREIERLSRQLGNLKTWLDRHPE